MKTPVQPIIGLFPLLFIDGCGGDPGGVTPLLPSDDSGIIEYVDATTDDNQGSDEPDMGTPDNGATDTGDEYQPPILYECTPQNGAISLITHQSKNCGYFRCDPYVGCHKPCKVDFDCIESTIEEMGENVDYRVVCTLDEQCEPDRSVKCYDETGDRYPDVNGCCDDVSLTHGRMMCPRDEWHSFAQVCRP